MSFREAAESMLTDAKSRQLSPKTIPETNNMSIFGREKGEGDIFLFLQGLQASYPLNFDAGVPKS